MLVTSRTLPSSASLGQHAGKPARGALMIRVAFAIGDYPEPERQLRADVALSYSTGDIEVGIVPVRASPYGGLGPAEIQLVAPYYHEAFLTAEAEGYDAAVPLGMLDLGV